MSAQTIRAKILVIDDDPDVMKAFTKMLERHGYEVMQANYALPALFRAARQPPDLILVDLDMPIMNGLELLHQFKHHHETRNIPVMVVTGSSDPADHEAAVKAGCAGFITKPVGMQEFIERVEGCLLQAVHRKAEPKAVVPEAEEKPDESTRSKAHPRM